MSFVISGYGDNTQLICIWGDCRWDKIFPVATDLAWVMRTARDHSETHAGLIVVRSQQVIEDPRPESARPCCILCAVWVCTECYNFHRTGAARDTQQNCPRCGGVEGKFLATRHQRRLTHYESWDRVIPWSIDRVSQII